MQVVQIVWLALLVVFIIAEASTASLVSIWFCAGAIVALLISLFAPGALAVQIAAFILVSALTLLLLRPMVKKLAGNRRVATNADAGIGKTAQVTEAIRPGQFGRVKLEGQVWTAVSDVELPAGAWCRVEAIDGVKLVVVPVSQPGPAPDGVFK